MPLLEVQGLEVITKREEAARLRKLRKRVARVCPPEEDSWFDESGLSEPSIMIFLYNVLPPLERVVCWLREKRRERFGQEVEGVRRASNANAIYVENQPDFDLCSEFPSYIEFYRK